MRNIKRKLYNRFNRGRCYLIRKSQKPIWPDRSKGYLTIFFDYEGDYAKPDKRRAEASIYGVKRILEICKKYNIKATFNTVGKLFYDHPDIIRTIIQDGHDVASHSFKHDDISTLSRDEIDNDIKLTKQAFKEFGLVLRGMRSPQGRWSFKQMAVMLENGLTWSAEGDQAEYPYIIYKRDGRSLVRFPITFGDYNFYISRKFTADEMYEKLIKAADHIQNKKIFGAIGFHPWVNGEDESRLHTMDNFFQYILKIPSLKIITFSEAYNLVVAHNGLENGDIG
jgi:peptidoglycan/xylan/chitin deacetylase (PgdA/CDA1 family)